HIVSEKEIDNPFFVSNADGSAFGNDPSRIKAIGELGKPLSRVSSGSERESTSVVACTSADGSLLPPFIIFKGGALQPRSTSTKAYPGTVYSVSSNSWMEELKFFNWFNSVFVMWVKELRSHLVSNSGKFPEKEFNPIELKRYKDNKQTIIENNQTLQEDNDKASLETDSVDETNKEAEIAGTSPIALQRLNINYLNGMQLGREYTCWLNFLEDPGAALTIKYVCRVRDVDEESGNIEAEQDVSSIEFNMIEAIWPEEHLPDTSTAIGIRKGLVKELFSLMDRPTPSPRFYRKLKNDVGKVWKIQLQSKMKKAADEKRKLAIEARDVGEGIPFITVIADGGWAKRDRIKEGAMMLHYLSIQGLFGTQHR
ncbi:hypothetical protein ILUMI_10290, partial [Ignelater luminosus]